MIVSYKLDSGEEVVYNEKPIESFKEDGRSEGNVRWRFYSQREKFEERIVQNIEHFDIEEYAKDRYDLVDESEIKDIDDFSDNEIKEEAKDRGLADYSEIEYPNILNESFISRFTNIVNRGNVIEIESVLQELENKYKICTLC